MRGVLSGLIAAFSLVAALHLRRFGRRTRDPFFNLFAVAFVLFAVTHIGLGVATASSEGAALYVIRLLAFLIILVAIWHKNRS